MVGLAPAETAFWTASPTISSLIRRGLGWKKQVRAEGNLCQNYVTGVVFLDYNENGIQEPGEPYTSGTVGLEQDGQLYAEKEADEYGFVFENVPCGVYQVLLDGLPVTEVVVDAVSPPLALALPKKPARIFLPYVSQAP